jgi:hypothetical protein
MVVLLRVEPNKAWWRSFVGLAVFRSQCREAEPRQRARRTDRCGAMVVHCGRKSRYSCARKLSSTIAACGVVLIAPRAGKLKVIYDRLDA